MLLRSGAGDFERPRMAFTILRSGLLLRGAELFEVVASTYGVDMGVTSVATWSICCCTSSGSAAASNLALWAAANWGVPATPNSEDLLGVFMGESVFGGIGPCGDLTTGTRGSGDVEVAGTARLCKEAGEFGTASEEDESCREGERGILEALRLARRHILVMPLVENIEDFFCLPLLLTDPASDPA